MTSQMSGVFYALTFPEDTEPSGFLNELARQVSAEGARRGSTRVGEFERLRIFSSTFTSVSDETTRRHTQYLFLVEGLMIRVSWIIDILERFGKVSFPVDGTWRWSSDNDIAAEPSSDESVRSQAE
jgi:hypothetical protein